MNVFEIRCITIIFFFTNFNHILLLLVLNVTVSVPWDPIVDYFLLNKFRLDQADSNSRIEQNNKICFDNIVFSKTQGTDAVFQVNYVLVNMVAVLERCMDTLPKMSKLCLIGDLKLDVSVKSPYGQCLKNCLFFYYFFHSTFS